MSDQNQPCCACLTVVYDPEPCDGENIRGEVVPNGAIRERWRCKSCGGVFARVAPASVPVTEALRDALSGWRYIRSAYGDLYGVGWDRVEKALVAALAAPVLTDAER